MTQQIEKFASVFKKKWMKKYLILNFILFFSLNLFQKGQENLSMFHLRL